MTWPWTDERNYKPARILVQDNDASKREMMTSLLAAEGYECRVAETLVETSRILRSGENIDLVLCGIAEWAEEDFKHVIWATDVVPVLVSTGIVGLMAKVLQMGAYDVLLKPFQREQLIFAVGRALEHRRLKIENFYLKDSLGLGSGIDFPLSDLVELRRKARNRAKDA
jgi:DNA-binding NtrC family response regulator